MPSQRLTAEIKFKVDDKGLKNTKKTVDDINKSLQKQQEQVNKVMTAIVKTHTKIQQNLSRTERLASAYQKVDRWLNRNFNTLSRVTMKVQNWVTGQNQVTNATKKTNSVLDKTFDRLKGIAATYLGIMGMKAIASASDTITSAENKLNYLNAEANGGAGYTASGGYKASTLNATQDQLDKIYYSAQNARTGYGDMVANVSKAITLAGGAFDNNIDNAIRFQEIMAKSYTLGGASAAEQASSMYQLIQGLGAGVLQGDELRSVREGAPLAYQEIEKFAQGVYNTEESLKDLASQGKITSEIVVAAMMNAGAGIDKAFENTNMTFDQMFTMTKNSLLQAFRPALQQLNGLLNSEQGKTALKGIQNAIMAIGRVALVVMNILSVVFKFIVDNWGWIKYIVLAGLTILGVAFGSILVARVVKGVKAIIGVLSKIPLPLWIIIAVIGAVIFTFKKLRDYGCSVAEALIGAILLVGVALLIVGVITGNVFMIITAGIMIVLALVYFLADKIIGCIYAVGAILLNILIFVVTAIANVIVFIGTTIQNIGIFIGTTAENIGIAFANAWWYAQATFWDFISNVLSGLKGLEEPINAILKAFDKDPISITGLADGATAMANAARGKIKDFKGYNFADYEYIQGNYKNVGDAYNKGALKGKGFQYWVNGKLASVADKFNGTKMLDENTVALDLSGVALDPYGAVSGIGGDVANISDNTDKISDTMDLTNENMDYLKELAEREAINRFTTAEIKVDMTNNNNVSSDLDLDGIVSHLSTTLREEMVSVANGVHY